MSSNSAPRPLVDRIEYHLGWADTNLRWLTGSINEMGLRDAETFLKEIVSDLRATKDPIWRLIRNDPTTPPNSLPEPAPMFGKIEIPSTMPEEKRHWLQAQLDEVERIIKSATQLAKTRSDIKEFPSREGFYGSWTRIRPFPDEANSPVATQPIALGQSWDEPFIGPQLPDVKSEVPAR